MLQLDSNTIQIADQWRTDGWQQNDIWSIGHYNYLLFIDEYAKSWYYDWSFNLSIQKFELNCIIDWFEANTIFFFLLLSHKNFAAAKNIQTFQLICNFLAFGF